MTLEATKNKVYKQIVERSAPKEALTKVYEMPGYIEAYTNEGRRRSKISNYRKLPKGKYLNLETGEICESKQGEARFRSHMNEAYRNLRRLINYYFLGEPNEVHITLTLAEEYKNLPIKEINEHFKRFWKSFVYRYPESEYIVIREISPKGRWHYHLLVKNASVTEFEPEADFVHKKWKLGLIHINHIINNDNVGAYFTVFDNNIPWFNERDGKSKGNIKRKYIKEFPKSVHLFDKSRGLKHPQPEEMTHEEFENRVKGLTPTFSRAYAVIVEADDRNIPVNYLYYEEYNLRRNK